MTKEELEKEARQKALEWNHKKINGKYNRPPIANWSCYEKGYLAGAEPREKRIAELEEENANVKETLEGYKKIAKWCDKCDKIADLKKENAEAKELLKRWVELSKPKLEGYPIPPIQEQTEHFLNSEVEK